MKKEEFVALVFSQSVQMYSTAANREGIDTSNGRDQFNKIYRFLELQLIERLEDAGINPPVKSPLERR